MKFGGTSVGSASSIEAVGQIVTRDSEREKIVVVSAQSGVTNLLLQALADASIVSVIVARLQTLSAELQVDPQVWLPLIESLHIALQKEIQDREKADLVASFGELISAEIVAQYLNRQGLKSVAVDARSMVYTDSHFTDAQCDLEVTRERAKATLLPLLRNRVVPVVTGFIGADVEGRTTTLGRGGSDLTATLLGQCLEADMVEIWSDADGIMSADPREVDVAQLVDVVSYEEAVECANFGAKIIYARSLIPAIAGRLPVRILNTFKPQASGTLIGPTGHEDNFVVTSQPGISTVTVYNPEMISAVGYLARLFEIFRERHLAVDILAASEASVSMTVDKLSPDEKDLLRLELAPLGRVSIENSRSLVAVVSPRLHQSILVALLLQELSKQEIQVEMISYGNSKLNLALVVSEDRRLEAVMICHKYLSENISQGAA